MTQAVLATQAPTGQSLEPLDRLGLRDQLQDLWRANVENITTLAVRFHSLESDDSIEDPVAIATRLARLRLDLTEIEAAMRRMDVGCYGGCESCAAPIPYRELTVLPARRRCATCEAAAPRWNRRVR